MKLFLLCLVTLFVIVYTKLETRNIQKYLKPLFTNIVIVGITINSSIISPRISNALVGEGDLPQGAMAFSKILKYQMEWKKLADNLSSRNYKMDDSEITGTKIFLKQLANEYYDMELLTKSISDTQKAAKAKEIAKDFRIKIRECDDEASNGNIAKIGENYPITSSEISQFLDLLRDVPDEL